MGGLGEGVGGPRTLGAVLEDPVVAPPLPALHLALDRSVRLGIGVGADDLQRAGVGRVDQLADGGEGA
eukprot:8761369-Pyramimonas_sp.AAC.1